MLGTDDISADPHAAAAMARAERRLAILAELTELGMDLVRDLGRQASAPPDTTAPPREPAEPFARLSRAIRLTLTLEARMDSELAALRAGAAIEVETRRVAAAASARTAAEVRFGDHRRAIDRAVREALDVEIPDPDERLACRHSLRERLLYDEAYANLETMSLTEVVRRLCADLGLSPDWSRWSEDGWEPCRSLMLADCESGPAVVRRSG
jgi:hypothetical protein